MCDSKKASHPGSMAGAFFCAAPGAGATRPVRTLAAMLWVKAFHIVFVASWFAGLFYLPRIFVNLAMVPPGSVAERERLLLMARKLLRFTTLLAVPALALGLWLWLGYGIGRGGNGWMHAKLAVVVLAIGYHHACAVLLRRFGAGGSDAQPPLVPLVQRAAGAAAAGGRGAGGRQAVLSDAMHKTSAWPLAQAYAALVVYASLYPFAGWRDQGIAPWDFLFEPAGRKYWTGFDLAANVVGYVPLGFLLALSFMRRGNCAASPASPTWRPSRSRCWPARRCRFCMEALQNYLPSRVPSNVDFGLNVAGHAGRGGRSPAALELAGAIDHWSRFRERWFVAEARGALVLLALWPFALLFPAAVPLGLGQVFERLEAALAEWLEDTPFLEWLPVRDVELQPLVPGGRTAVRGAGRPHALPAGLLGHPLGRPARGVRGGRGRRWASAPRRCRRP